LLAQTYYPVPEQILINNHALLVFKRRERTLLFMADIDEFFNPVVREHFLQHPCIRPVVVK
jgi:hypothetical protein